MSFKKITENVSNITLLADQPSLSANLLKKEFDKGNETIKTAFNNQVDDLNEFVENIADEYDNTSTYKVGDYCIYENKVYKCITEITTPESFDSSKWELVRITDEINKTLDTFHYSTTIVGSGNLASGAWRKIYVNVNTGIIKKGTYLLFVPFTLAGASGSNGIASGRVTINGTEISKSSRQSLPVGTASLLVSQTIIVLWEVTNEAEYTLNCEVYSSVNFSLRNTSGIELIKIK